MNVVEAKSRNQALLIHAIKLVRPTGGNDCVEFLIGYGEFVELYDDFIDKDKGDISIHTIKTKLVDIMSGAYWRKYADSLYLVEKLISLQFHDTVVWENSDELWKREHAKVLSHCAYNMLFAVMIIEIGLIETQKFSAEFRETCHVLHMEDKI
jgi:hypothetical protein